MPRSSILVPLQRTLAAAALLLAAAACDRPGADASIAGGAAERRPASEHLSSLTGLSHMPAPENNAAFNASIRRHYPREMLRAGRGGDVLVDVRLDASGRVLDVDVVEERKTVGDEHQIVVRGNVPGSDLQVEREVKLNYDPEAFGAAAAAAIREVRFHPALRDGKGVPYTWRMTVRFTPPAAR